MTKRKMVVDHKNTLDFIYMSIDSAIDMLTDIKKRHGGDTIINYDYVYNYDDNKHYYYEVYRPETDDEMNKRIVNENRVIEERKIRDFNLYKELELKYKDKS